MPIKKQTEKLVVVKKVELPIKPKTKSTKDIEYNLEIIETKLALIQTPNYLTYHTKFTATNNWTVDIHAYFRARVSVGSNVFYYWSPSDHNLLDPGDSITHKFEWNANYGSAYVITVDFHVPEADPQPVATATSQIVAPAVPPVLPPIIINPG
jgi:hypothetical protein